jgi:hypothetical protein
LGSWAAWLLMPPWALGVRLQLLRLTACSMHVAACFASLSLCVVGLLLAHNQLH